jgi:tryptophanyl-tRNA synthetase
MLDTPSKIKKSIMRATTDSDGFIAYDLENKPGISNLLTIYAQFSGLAVEDVVKKFDGQGYGNLKKELVELSNFEIGKVQAEYQRILDDGIVYDVLKAGRDRANTIATEVLDRVREKIGFVTF